MFESKIPSQEKFTPKMEYGYWLTPTFHLKNQVHSFTYFPSLEQMPHLWNFHLPLYNE